MNSLLSSTGSLSYVMGDEKPIERFGRRVTEADLHFGKLTLPTVLENRGEKHRKIRRLCSMLLRESDKRWVSIWG